MIAVLDPVRYAAVNAHVRARLDRMLPPGLWTFIIGAPDLGAFLQFLWDTPYQPVLTQFAGERPKLEQVERALWEHLADVSRTPLSMMHGAPRDLLDWFWRRFEVENLKTVLRTVERGVPSQRVRESLIRLGPASDLPWTTLAEAVSVPAVVERLRSTFYGRVLRQALDRYRRERLLFLLEVALDLGYYRRLLRYVGELGGRDEQEAERFIGTLVDSQNLLWAFRFRIYFDLSPEEILNYTLQRGLRVDASVVQQIAVGTPVLDVVRQLWEDDLPGLGRLVGVSDAEALPELELIFRRYLYDLAQDALRGYPFHLGVVLAYEILLESEVRDLVTVVEGQAAGWDPDRIRPYLIGLRG